MLYRSSIGKCNSQINRSLVNKRFLFLSSVHQKVLINLALPCLQNNSLDDDAPNEESHIQSKSQQKLREHYFFQN